MSEPHFDTSHSTRHIPVMFSTLISAQDLAQHASDPNWLVVDCRFDLAQPDSGERAYREGHIPGAVYAHLDRDLSSPITKHTGRHPLPDPNELAKRLGAWGVSRDTQVIAYDADTGAYAARLWWLLRWVGHEAVAVLDGGLRAWREAGLPLTSEIPKRSPTRFEPHPDRGAWLSAEEVAAKLRDGWRLLDARAPERFAGKVEPIDPIAGHIPGAVNHPLTTNLGSNGRFLNAEELRNRYSASQAGVIDDRTIAMCGSGVTACHLLLAMEIAGKKGARLYAGSWSEWIRDPTRPITIGSE
jgi:thiosulfate/3-mercaptopyruvate sulfurtransferase